MRYIHNTIDYRISDFVDELDERYIQGAERPLHSVFLSIWPKLGTPVYKNFNR